MLLGDCQAEPRGVDVILPAESSKQAVAAPGGLSKYAAVIGFSEQPVALFESVPSGASRGQRGSLVYGVNRARPFARRRLITRRPALVAMRARNP